MAKKILVQYEFQGGAGISGLPPSGGNGEPVVHEQLLSAIEGIKWKASARVATQSNVNLASPGAAIDGVTLSPGDRVLVRAQTDDAENGVYVFNGAATPMTRAADASTFAELEAAVLTVEEGTSAGVTYRQTEVNGTIDTDDVLWTTFGTSVGAASESSAGVVELATQAEVDAGTDTLRAVTPAGLAGSVHAAKRYAANLGDGSATQYDLSHNLGTRDCIPQVYRNGSPWDVVECDIEKLDANTVRLRFASAPTSNQYRLVVLA